MNFNYECICEICGKGFRNKRRRNRGKVCGSECSVEFSKRLGFGYIELKCTNCGVTFKRKSWAKRTKTGRVFCTPLCMQKWNSENSKRGGGRKYSIKPMLRFSAFERDGFKCYYCGRCVDDGIKLHVDHIIPRSKDGQDVLHNLITSCDECNVGKSDKELRFEHKPYFKAEQLGLFKDGD